MLTEWSSHQESLIVLRLCTNVSNEDQRVEEITTGLPNDTAQLRTRKLET